MDIDKVLQTLKDLKSQGVVEGYALGGAVAATYFLEPISTQDVDVFVRLKAQPGKALLDPSPIFAFLSERGFEMEGEYAIIGGWPVQFLAPPGALGEEALENALTVDAGGTSSAVLGAEYLAAIALSTARPKDKARLLMFLESPEFDKEKFLAILRRHQLDANWSTFSSEFGLEP